MTWDGILIGMAVAGFNGSLALAAVRWGLTKNMQTFLVVFMGGMALRFVLVAVLSVLVIKLTSTHVPSYAISLVVCYIALLLVEIFYVYRKNKNKKKDLPGSD